MVIFLVRTAAGKCNAILLALALEGMVLINSLPLSGWRMWTGRWRKEQASWRA
jgi:hypothetical protein